MQTAGKLEGIEALRGLAVLFTVFAHLPLTTSPFLGSVVQSPWHMGVTVFFAISGWIIACVTSSYSVEQVPEFFLKRFFRVVPVLIFTCAMAILFSIALPHTDLVNQFYPETALILRASAANLLFISDFADALGITTPYSLLGLWSISVEVKFYLVYSVILFLPKSARTSSLVLLAVMALSLRWVGVSRGNAYAFSHVFFVEALLFGSIAFRFNLHGIVKSRMPPRALPGIACALLLFIFLFPSFVCDGMHWLIGYVLTIGACVCLVNISAAYTNSPGNLTVLRWLGARSYSLYVLHFQFLAVGGLVGQTLGLNFSSPRAYDFLLIIFLFLGLPVLEFVHKCIELPLVAYSKRISTQIGSTAITA